MTGLEALFFHKLNDLRRLHLQSRSQLKNDRDGGLIDASFNQANVVPLNPSLKGQRLLRQASFSPQGAQHLAKSFSRLCFKLVFVESVRQDH